MFKIRADILKTGINGSISFSEYSRGNFDNEMDAWNYIDKFKAMIEEFFDMKGYVTCYVAKYENGKEILMCKLR